MFYKLKMPDSLTRVCLQRNQAVCKQVVAGSVRAVKVKRRRSCWNKHDPSLLIESDTRPGICAAEILPSICRPSLIAELTGMRYRVKRPSNLPRVDVERPDVARSRRK